MTFPAYFNSKNSLNLFSLFENFNFLKKLYIKKKLPKVLMLSGKKGSGKATIINHLMFFIFDNNNYNKETCELDLNSFFYNQFINDLFSNIIYVSGTDFKNTKIDNIRSLKKKIYQSSISEKPRFIIFNDVELFSNNSLNALLKIIEEPTKNNYFILINNKSKSLIETINSRCLDIKVILKEKNRQDIIESLTKKFSINLVIDPKTCMLTPGQFIKLNYIYDKNKILPDEDFLKNLTILLNLYKKEKNPIFIDTILFLTDDYFNKLKSNNNFVSDKILESKSFIFESINKFFLYNLNQNALLNHIKNKIKYE